MSTPEYRVKLADLKDWQHERPVGEATYESKPREVRMAITQMTRFKSDKAEEMIKNAKNAKTIFEKHGAEFLRLSRFHTGIWAGEWLVVTRYASWEVYGKAQEGLAKDPAFAKLLANTATIAQLMGRNLTVSVDL
jgi:hypothetical protein